VSRLASILSIPNWQSKGLHDFEDMFIQALSLERATQMLKRNLQTDLVYTITNAEGNSEAHILSLIS
jgi:hypothetical protein